MGNFDAPAKLRPDAGPSAVMNDSASVVSSQKSSESCHLQPSAAPTQVGPEGIRYDFNQGARIVLPEGEWAATLRDAETGNILFSANRGGVTINSAKRFFVRFQIEVRDATGAVVLDHRYDARDREVLITLPVGTLGDSLAWLPYTKAW